MSPAQPKLGQEGSSVAITKSGDGLMGVGEGPQCLIQRAVKIKVFFFFLNLVP